MALRAFILQPSLCNLLDGNELRLFGVRPSDAETLNHAAPELMKKGHGNQSNIEFDERTSDNTFEHHFWIN